MANVRILGFWVLVVFFLGSCSVSQTVGKKDFTHNRSRTPRSTKTTIRYPKSRPVPIEKQKKRKKPVGVISANESQNKSNGKHHYIVEPRMAIVDFAKSFVGTRYRYGGRDKKGFDCSGFTSYVMDHFGVSIPGTSKLQSKQGYQVHWKKAQPGDLIFFGRGGKVNHVGLVTQNTGRNIYIVHSTSSSGVRVDEIRNNSYWAPRIFGAASYLNHPQIGWEAAGED